MRLEEFLFEEWKCSITDLLMYAKYKALPKEENDIFQVKDIDKNMFVIKTLTYSEIYEIILNQEKGDFDKEEKEEKVIID